MKVLLALLAALAFAGARGNQNSIEDLKKTPVAKLEAGLPEKAFDSWLKELTKSAQPKYEMTDCQASGTGATGKCISVTADAEPMRRVALFFAIPADSTAQASVCTFLRGTVGPSDPRNKQPTRLVRKLTELEGMLR